MKTYEIKSAEWQSKLNRVSQTLENRKINIEVVGLDIGDQIEAKSVTLKGLVYDPKNDIVEISSEWFEHIIQSPRAIYFSEDMEGVHSVEFIDHDDRRQILTFEAPLLLR